MLNPSKSFKKLIFIFISLNLVSFILVLIFILSDFIYALTLNEYNYSKRIFPSKEMHNKILYKNTRFKNKNISNNPSHTYIFMGCSYMDGDDLKLNETLAGRIYDIEPTSSTVNFGIGGGGIHNALYYVKNKHILEEHIKLNNSIVIYGIHYDQINRSGFWRSYCCPPRGPKYKIENDKVVFKGFLEDFFSNDFFDFYPLSSVILNRMNIKSDVTFTAKASEHYCRLAVEFNNEVVKNGGKVYFFSYENFIDTPKLRGCLEKNNLTVFDVTSVQDGPYISEETMHPTAEYTEILAKEVYERIILF